MVKKVFVRRSHGYLPGGGGGGGGGGTQIWFRRGCAAEAAKPVPIFKGLLPERVPIIRGLAEKGTHY